MIEKLVIATRNTAKAKHYQNIFSGLVKTIVNLNDLEIVGKPEEIGNSAENNAEIKAKFYAKQTDLPVFSEDEGLYADFLPIDQQPGPFVRRLDGKNEATDDELLSYWENKIKTVSKTKRTGYWHFAYCLVNQGKTKIISQNVPIKFFHPSSKIRIPGWPLSSITGSFNKPHSEYTAKENQLHEQRDQQSIKPIIEQLLLDSF